MKLGIIMQPESGCFERAKELGLDFVEFDCNPVEYFGRPVEELWNSRETLEGGKQADRWGGRRRRGWASRILDRTGAVIQEEWTAVSASLISALTLAPSIISAA